MKPPKVVDAGEVQAMTRISPADRIIQSLDGEYYTMRQTAEKVDVHIETLRRLCKTDKVDAPSKAVRQGGLVIYLFTPDDVKEVQDYFNGKTQVKGKGEPKRKRLD